MKLQKFGLFLALLLFLTGCANEEPSPTTTETPVEESTEPIEETTEEVTSEENLVTFGNDTIGYFDLPEGTTEENQEGMIFFNVKDYPFSYIVTTTDDSGFFSLEQSMEVTLSAKESMDATDIESSYFEVDGAKGFYIKSHAFNDTNYSYEIRNPYEEKTIRIERQSMGISMGEQKEKEGDFLLESYRLKKDSQEKITLTDAPPIVLGTKEEGQLEVPEELSFDSENHAAVKSDDPSSYIQPQLMSIDGDFDEYLAQYKTFAEENNITLSRSEVVTIKDREMLLLEGQFSTGEYYRYYAYPTGLYYMNWHVISPEESFITEWSTYFEEHIALP